ncbi:MAG: tetratricopeptide repeat protein [Rhodothermaceae bacterium]|nr:tetratricopeptide repeat protein [Rhodothermaceae bacterium]
MSSDTTDSTQHGRIKALFLDALDQPEGDRLAWLAEASAGDDALRDEVETLLEAHLAAEEMGRLDAPLLLRPREPATDRMLGRPVGRWQLAERIGVGGMGAVYRAERADGAYERTVAVKLLRPGSDADTLAHRLRAERRLLARLEHPNIARLYDGGVTEDGLPYLALEYVEGEPITAYTDREGLPIEARLALFLQVCEAVAYAHRSLIIHRDLKPSNILVTDTDGAASVRLLDFGIAKLLDDADDESVATRTGLFALTPAYAAPEQLRGQPITTATDVYGLGVVLYELLAEQRPYDLTDKTATEVEQIVCEADPPRPSAVTGQPRLRGDLDTIVLKALAKEPERRYASAEALAEDLRRHLDGLPVHARPATTGYRIRKFVERHRVGVMAAALVVLALVGALAVSLRQTRTTQIERRKAERVNTFLQEMLASANPYEGSRTLTVEEVLDAAADRVETELAEESEIEAAVRHTLGTTYRALGRVDEAEVQLERALALRQRRYGAGHVETAASLDALGLLALDRAAHDRADSLLGLALAVRRRVGSATDRAETLLHVGRLRQSTNKPAEAEAHFREALALLPATAYADQAEALSLLGTLLYEQGRYPSADSVLAAAARTIRTHLGETDPRLGPVLNIHAWVSYYLGDFTRVEPLLNEALAVRRAAFGPDHPEVGLTYNELGWFHHDRSRPALADSLFRQALAVHRQTYGDDHADIPSFLINIAAAQRDLGNLDEAAARLDEALTLRRRLVGDDHPSLGYVYNNLARVEQGRGRLAEAERLFRKGLALRRRHLPAGHTDIGTSLHALAEVLRLQGRLSEAEGFFREALVVKRAALGPDHGETALASMGLAECLLDQGIYDEAESLLLPSLAAYEAAYGPEDPYVQRFLQALVTLYDAQENRDAAARYRARLSAP